MNRLDVEGVLKVHAKRQPLIGHSDWRCMYCDWTGAEDEYDAHVAAALCEQIATWLTGEFDRRWDAGDFGAAETVDALRKQVQP